ncbi:lipoprotein [Spiroplasma endosymbiont of Atherix ibis]|uniref:lipoprotein n=1 Tax=Spiroplasma endosymbiont of Atherix ibis TaxID=3066291 RepID=UPI0030D4B72B
MKKLLSLLATTGLVATTSSTVVACGDGEAAKNKNVTLDKQSIEVTQGGTGEISITSTNDLTGVKIEGQVENKVTATVQDKKIKITVSETAEEKDYILTITGDKINSKHFLVKVKEKSVSSLTTVVKTNVILYSEIVEVTQGGTGEISITSTNDLTGVKIEDQVENKVTTAISGKKIIITVSETAEEKDYILKITGKNINSKTFKVIVKAEPAVKTDVILDKEIVEVTKGGTGEVSIISENDLAGVKIGIQVAGKVTTAISGIKITITVSKAAEVGDYTLTITGNNINSKTFKVRVKAEPAVKTDVILDKEIVEVTKGGTGEVSIISENDLAGVKIGIQVENKVTTAISRKKIIITVSEEAEVGDYTLTITGNNINSKTFKVKVLAK